MKVIIFGAGVQGAFHGVCLAQAGHDVTLVARGKRAEELRARGTIITEALTGRTDRAQLPVIERIIPGVEADICLVTVRREQIREVLPDLAATAIRRIVFMVNHANGSAGIIQALGRARVVLAFPGVAGGLDDGIVSYIKIEQQPTAVESNALDIISLFQDAGLRVSRVGDMAAWLRRHAVFVTAMAGALYESGGAAQSLAASRNGVRTFIAAVREGWSALDRRQIEPAPLALRAIFCWVPLLFAVAYWKHLIASERGELFFARHVRHAPAEMAALAADVCELLDAEPTPCLDRLYAAILKAAADCTPQHPTRL